MDQAKETRSFRDQERVDNLRASIASLEAKYARLEADLASVTAQLKDDYNTTCVRYTQLLHEYNDIRDVGQGLMELIADARGVRQVEVVREFGFSEED
ncbi:hypothetical protein E8E15_006192 [Penicillium rubens]|uniref:Pc20g01230 protein n=1 Tax=Penicillium rubens (strain ATCC 28089 / DSM 1075 / NRRL 1951 / Wisconsin 54-1255) TaxID=500485 RepID=B6HH47_PENRW|nr:hypothetical protein E8E15_006192 [Penicillium rubens]CAP85452.1 Pc20g01230 [Penicillium rubens Wisconsin 54-1255]